MLSDSSNVDSTYEEFTPTSVNDSGSIWQIPEWQMQCPLCSFPINIMQRRSPLRLIHFLVDLWDFQSQWSHF